MHSRIRFVAVMGAHSRWSHSIGRTSVSLRHTRRILQERRIHGASARVWRVFARTMDVFRQERFVLPSRLRSLSGHSSRYRRHAGGTLATVVAEMQQWGYAGMARLTCSLGASIDR
ncbi:hypothetical protein PRIPAC_93625 [Pristionchus pacificus]|nr:hypothetical protein PRIPAC_93625 [Pristionchus pacificus]